MSSSWGTKLSVELNPLVTAPLRTTDKSLTVSSVRSAFYFRSRMPYSHWLFLPYLHLE